MPSRRKSREQALQILFQLDASPQPVEEAIAAFYASLSDAAPDQFTEELVRGVTANRDALDALIRKHSQHWRLERMPVVDRNLLRLALYEMTVLKGAPAVVIDEALEIAKRFSGEESVAFINGVLDAVRKFR